MTPSSEHEASGASDPADAVRDLRRAVANARRRARRNGRKLEARLAECDEAPSMRRDGELLKAALADIERGASEAVVPDWFSSEPGATRRIELDPSRPPRDTMQKLFKQASRLEKNRSETERRIAENVERLSALERLLAEMDTWIESADDGATLPAAFLERARALDVVTEPDAAPPKAAAPPERPVGRREKERRRLMNGVRVFESADGLEILVGRTDADNDALTFRIARGRDWWFHLAPAPGSHVVARGGGDALPQETLLDAAHLAVHFSKMRGVDRTEVHYTRANEIRRIKGAPPGKVRLEHHRTLAVRMEQPRLDRLLGARRPEG